MIPVLSAYKDREWAFPKQNINPDKKDAEYHKSWSKGIYSLFCSTADRGAVKAIYGNGR